MRIGISGVSHVILALALDTPLPTPTGWTTRGEVAGGALLLDAEGQPTRVVAATEVLEGRPCYELTFSDGSVIVADAEHQWRVSRAGASLASWEIGVPTRTSHDVVTTRELAASGEVCAIAMPDGSHVKVEAVAPISSVVTTEAWMR